MDTIGSEPVKRLTKKQTIIFIAIMGLIIGIVGGALWSDESEDAQNGSSSTYNAADMVADAGIVLQSVSVTSEALAKRACHTEYDYPGCSPAQAANLEAGTNAKVRANYDKGRWGQGANGGGTRNQWDNLTPSRNNQMKVMFEDAVQRFTKAKAARLMKNHKGMSKDEALEAARPAFTTWGGFKSNMDCGGNFGVYSGAVSLFCKIQKPINEMVDQTTGLVLACDGVVLSGAATGGAAGYWDWTNTTVAVGALVGGASAAIGCTVNRIYDSIF